jgi:predicted PolB exonuclease-like 3'-5' exonuclease
MGFNSQEAFRSALVFDCETVAIDGAGNYLEPVSAPSNYKDETKIAAYCEQAQREQLNKAALDVDLGRIVALGIQGAGDDEPVVRLAQTEDDERGLLTWFWGVLGPIPAKRPTLIGYNCIGYDLPLLLRRSVYLNVPVPRLPINKYRHDGIEDLMLTLSFDGSLKFRGLSFYCKRFGLDVPCDETDGSQIAALHAAGDWAGIEAHCRADVLKTAALARRIGVLASQPVLAEQGVL